MSSKKFSDFFPLPKFLAMPAAGLHIAEDALRVVEFSKSKTGLALKLFGERPIPAGIIVGGEIINKEALRAALRALRLEFKLKFVNASLPEEKAFLYKTEVPNKAESNIREFLELRLEENVPIAVGEAVFDYSFIKKENRGSDHIDVSVSVVPERIVASYVDVIHSAGLVPIVMQTEAQTVAQSVVPLDDMSTYLVVSFGETKTGLFIISEGVARYTSVLSIGGDAITIAVGKHYRVGLDEAKKIKEQKAYTRNKANMELFFSLMNTVSIIKDEVAKIMHFWHTHRDNNNEPGTKIQTILLCGSNSAIVGFDEYLSLSMQTRVALANVWSNTFSFENYIPPIQFVSSLDYAQSIGLALIKNS